MVQRWSDSGRPRAPQETTDFDQLPPHERMRQFSQHLRAADSGLSEYLESLPFAPDPFQVEALESFARGSSVLVCAPTGAGKTVVGEGAVAVALHGGEQAYYTTPIKALSNQKYREFCQTFGEDNVGLLTGDASINPHAPVVVMTTEVLRNMIYAESKLSELRVVVMDEIHYLADRVRGPVWEEILIELPERIQIVALSATVSNAQEFGRWIAEVRGNCDVIVTTHRPVPLYQQMIVGSRLYDLFVGKSDGTETATPRLNPDLSRAVDGDGPTGPRSVGARHRPQRRPQRVSRPRVVSILDHADLLPAIVFIFSRAGCDEAVQQMLRSGVSLTDREQQQQIRAEAEKALLSIPVADHRILGLSDWVLGLERGIAAHHAGMLPILKETVEKLFAAGLVQLVFATETLALGINMPARTVVLESLQKWNGSEHVRLSAGEYTQLTGRAGRRGIDVEGHAVTLHRGTATPEEVSQLASRHSYPLKSAFYPNYNMVVNLLNHSSIPAVRQVMESSFAQYQADDSVVELAAKLRRTEAKLEEMRGKIRCDVGDAPEYFELRENLARTQKHLQRALRESNRDSVRSALIPLRAGDVIQYQHGRRWRLAAVVTRAEPSWSTPQIRVVGENAKVFTLGPREINRGPEVVGHVRIPSGGARRPRDRQGVVKQMRALGKVRPPAPARQSAEVQQLQWEEQELQASIRRHPVHSCPDRDTHANLGHEWVRTKREVNRLVSQINSRTSSIVHEFDRVCTVLERTKYLEGGRVTARGQQLRRIFGERDLLVAECVWRDVFLPLDASEVAALASALVYEPRGETGERAEPDLPTPALKNAWGEVKSAYAYLHSEEKKARVARLAEPSADIVGITYKWANGSTLATVLPQSSLTGGDFVRWMRQSIDLLEQLRRIDDDELREKVTTAVRLLRRGVVAWSED